MGGSLTSLVTSGGASDLTLSRGFGSYEMSSESSSPDSVSESLSILDRAFFADVFVAYYWTFLVCC